MKKYFNCTNVKRLIVSLSVFIFAILILFLLNKYRDFKFYKNENLNSLSFNIGLQLRTYYNSHCSYPANGKIFLEFLERDGFFEDRIIYKNENVLIKNGLGLINNKNDSSIIIIAYGKDGFSNEDNSYIFPNKMNFYNYLFSDKDIYLTSIERCTCCYLFPNNLIVFKNGIPLNPDDQLQRIISISLKGFTKNYFNNALIWIEPSNEQILRYKILNSKNRIKIETVCSDDILNKEYTNQIIDSLTDYFMSLNLKIDYDSIYFNFKVNQDYLKIQESYN